jgi:3-phosphoshikimate 1-carboxyvinyltransferase
VEVTEVGDRVRFRGPVERPLVADLRETPDLFPALSVVAATVTGSKLTGLDHLKHKESDRLAVMVANLGRLGCEIEVDDAAFRVHRPLQQAHPQRIEVTAADDHRIAMAMAVAALRVGPIDLDDPDCVVKSFPGFWETWREMLEGAGTPP